jgi:hypothetical protein
VAGKGFAERVDRAGPDIAKNDTDRADCQFHKWVTVVTTS